MEEIDRESLFVFEWCTVQHLEVGLDERWHFQFGLCIFCHSKVEIDFYSQFDFGRCNTLNLEVGRGSQFELEWYRVWYLREAGMDWGFQSEWEWCSSALPFQDHLLSYLAAFSS